MSMTTEIQNYNQTEGPHRPTAEWLRNMMQLIPNHHEIRAISINGQTGRIVVETYHEGLNDALEMNNI